MALDKLLDLSGVPKAVIEGAQSFLNRLLGPAVDETGQLLADKVRYRRFRNQVRIAEGAQRLVEAAGLSPVPVPLQILVPLVEKASLEEDPTVQEMWSTLLANAATAKARHGLHRLCVEVLAGISPKEALILRHVYAQYQQKRPELLTKVHNWNPTRTEIPAEFLIFRPRELYRDAGVPETDGDLLLDNLLRLNLLRWEIPEVKDGQTVHSDFVHLTELGLAVLKEFNAGPSA
jgi:hypothetical protein